MGTKTLVFTTVNAEEWNEPAFELVRHCDAAVAKPEYAIFLFNHGSRLYDCCAAGRSLTLKSIKPTTIPAAGTIPALHSHPRNPNVRA
jgi:hypothetical protein